MHSLIGDEITGTYREASDGRCQIRGPRGCWARCNRTMLPATGLLVVFFLSAWCTTVYAQSTSRRFTSFSTDHGLSAEIVTAVVRDSIGYVWVGTTQGLNRFDGTDFQTFSSDPSDPWSLPNNYVRDILVDHFGILWVATEGGGLARLDSANDRFASYMHDPGSPSSISDNVVETLFEDRAGNLWIGTNRGVDRLNRDTETFSHIDLTLPGNQLATSSKVAAIEQTPDGEIWIGRDDGSVLAVNPETGFVRAVSLETDSTTSGLDALDKTPEVALLCTDVVLPGGMNGLEMAQEAQRRNPDLPVLYMSGYTENAIIHHGRLDAGVHLLEKPFSKGGLARKVRELLRMG